MRSAVPFTLFCVCWMLPAAIAAESDVEALRSQLEAVLQHNAELVERLDRLEAEVRQARDEATAAREMAEAPAPVASGGSSGPSGAVASAGRFQLLDVSMDVLTSVGGSSARGERLERLQAGGHDPRRRGFNLQNVELSLLGAVDPWLDGEVHLIYFIDPEGESVFEVEEAFATTRMLPFGLEERGLAFEIGQSFTEFGQINPQHPHEWDWQDQPIVNSRFFGADGMRGVGVQGRWLLPTEWYSEVVFGVQNAQGETMTSFLASDEVFEERAIAGRPFASNGTRSLGDMVWLARWVNAFDLSDTWTLKVGGSGLYGPNATGGSGWTTVFGADAKLLWRPLSSDRGWPYLKLQGEILGRRYRAAAFSGCVDEDCGETLTAGAETLDDWGFYAQALWGFERGWAAGLRYEYAAGSDGDLLDASDDPFRDRRHRVSPMIAWHPSEFSRLRLQYNLDHSQFDGGGFDHTLWFGLEFLFGQHPAHTF